MDTKRDDIQLQYAPSHNILLKTYVMHLQFITRRFIKVKIHR